MDIVKTLFMRTIDPHGQSNPFSRSNESQSVHTPHFINFSCAIPNYFLGDPDSNIKNTEIFCGRRQDLGYAAGWPSRPVRPIFKVKRSPKHAYPPFRRFLCAIPNHFLGYLDSNVKNAEILCGHPSRPWLGIRLTLISSPTHFKGQTSSEVRILSISTIFMCYRKSFCGWSKFQRQKCQHCFWASVKFLAIQPLSLRDIPTHFKGQTRPKAYTPSISMIFVCYRKSFVGWSGFRRQKYQNFLWTSVRTFSMNSFGPHGQYDSFSSSNKLQSVHTIHFNNFCVLQQTNFLVIWIPSSKMPNFFMDEHEDLGYSSEWTSRTVRRIFKVERAPKPASPPFWWFTCVIANHFLVIRMPMSKIPQDLVYTSGCPSRPVWPIFKVLRAPKHA